jgi:tetrahydromethanopterin S-methyltransferase subunit G
MKKNIVQQVDSSLEVNLVALGRSIGILMAIVISGGLVLSWIFGFD